MLSYYYIIPPLVLKSKHYGVKITNNLAKLPNCYYTYAMGLFSALNNIVTAIEVGEKVLDNTIAKLEQAPEVVEQMSDRIDRGTQGVVNASDSVQSALQKTDSVIVDVKPAE